MYKIEKRRETASCCTIGGVGVGEGRGGGGGEEVGVGKVCFLSLPEPSPVVEELVAPRLEVWRQILCEFA